MNGTNTVPSQEMSPLDETYPHTSGPWGFDSRRPSHATDVSYESSTAMSTYSDNKRLADDDDEEGAEEVPPTGKTTRRHRERNRLAAAKCRQKAKQSSEDLQERERQLLQQNRMLQAYAASLQEEIDALKDKVLAHSSCDNALIQNYITRKAMKACKG